MKVLLKFVILCAWLLFVAALWQNCRVPVTSPVAWSHPSLGMLSISRKMTDAQLAVHRLPDMQSVAGPAPQLFLITPATSR